MILKPTAEAVAIFGRGVHIYAPMVNAIASGLDQEPYGFIDSATFEEAVRCGELDQAGIGRIVWFEILQRARLAATLSIIRTASWIEASVREHQAGAFAPFTACCRALVEATGDSCDALNFVALTLAEQSEAIRRELGGQGCGIVSQELEDALIEFTHARKIPNGTEAPAHHNAKPTWEYIKVLTRMQLPAAGAFYGALCERMHPAKAGLDHYYGPGHSGGFQLTLSSEVGALEAFVAEYQETLHGILPLALNPALLTLRVCGSFGLWSIPEILEATDFGPIPIWQRISEALELSARS